MMKKLLCLCFLVAVLFNLQCKQDNNDFEDNARTSVEDICVKVLSEEGLIIDHAVVTIDGKKVGTDRRGYAFFKDIALSSAGTVVQVDCKKYTTTIKRIYPSQEFIVVGLMRKHAEYIQSIDASKGGAVVRDLTFLKKELWDISFPPNAFVDEKGQDYNGMVSIEARYFPPQVNHLAYTMPGDLRATDTNGKAVVLGSFGMINIEAFVANTEKKVFLKKGVNAKIKLPIIDAQQSTAPQSISQWYFDAQTATWKEDGTAIRNGNFYEMSIANLAVWGCNASYSSKHWISGKVITDKGIPLTNNSLEISFDGFTIPIYIGAGGYFNTLVPGSKNLTLTKVTSLTFNNTCKINNNIITIGQITSDKDLGNLVITPDYNNLIEITGKLVDCNGKPMPYIYCSEGYLHSYVLTDKNGTFSDFFCKDANKNALGKSNFFFYNQNYEFLKKEIDITSSNNLGIVEFCDAKNKINKIGGSMTIFSDKGPIVMKNIEIFESVDWNYYTMIGSRGTAVSDTFARVYLGFTFDKNTNNIHLSSYSHNTSFMKNGNIAEGLSGGYKKNEKVMDLVDLTKYTFKGRLTDIGARTNAFTTILFDIKNVK